MKVIYWLAFLSLIGLNVKAQNKTWKPEFQVNTSYNAYFQQAYGIYDRVPKGILEAISIDFTSNALGKAHLKAFNLNGQLVYSLQNEVNEGYNAMEINVNEWVPGIYFLEITTESGEVSRAKFVVSD